MTTSLYCGTHKKISFPSPHRKPPGRQPNVLADQPCQQCSHTTHTMTRETMNSLHGDFGSSDSSTSSKALSQPQNPSCGAHLCFLSPQPDTSLHCESETMNAEASASHGVTMPTLTPQLLLLLIVPTHQRMARLS